MQNPDITRGAIQILFNPDEEIGRGADKVDVKNFGAQFAYTMDGGPPGISRTRPSRPTAPPSPSRASRPSGLCEGQVVNAIKIAGDIIARLPRDTCRPRRPKARKALFTPSDDRSLENAAIGFILRDFTDEAAPAKGSADRGIVREVMKEHPGSTSVASRSSTAT